MLRCRFLCHVLKALFFIKIALKLSYFWKKNAKFRALGAKPPDPRASGSWGLRPQTPKTASPLRIFRYAPGYAKKSLVRLCLVASAKQRVISKWLLVKERKLIYWLALACSLLITLYVIFTGSLHPKYPRSHPNTPLISAINFFFLGVTFCAVTALAFSQFRIVICNCKYWIVSNWVADRIPKFTGWQNSYIVDRFCRRRRIKGEVLKKLSVNREWSELLVGLL